MILFKCECKTHSECRRGDEKGRNFRFEMVLYCTTESTEYQNYRGNAIHSSEVMYINNRGRDRIMHCEKTLIPLNLKLSSFA